MASPEAEAAAAAFADALVPSPPDDETAGAADVAAERFLLHYLEFVRAGLAEILAKALDGIVAWRRGVEYRPGLFAELDPASRLEMIEALGRHDLAELRDLSDLACALVVAGFYGEWTGHDAAGVLRAKPIGWTLTRHDGPARSVPGLLRP